LTEREACLQRKGTFALDAAGDEPLVAPADDEAQQLNIGRAWVNEHWQASRLNVPLRRDGRRVAVP
jgi:hypothetical protein